MSVRTYLCVLAHTRAKSARQAASVTPSNPLGDRLKSWWSGPISWKWMLLLGLAVLSMVIFPLVAIIYSALVAK